MADLNLQEKVFAEAVRHHLEILNEPLRDKLREMFSKPIPNDMKVLSFEIFSDDFTGSFPVTGYPMDASNSQTDWPPYGYAFELLPDVVAYPSSLEEPYENDDSFDAWGIATKTFIPWFHEQWLAAGGSSFAIPATIAHHDEIEEFNLQTGKWQEAHALFE